MEDFTMSGRIVLLLGIIFAGLVPWTGACLASWRLVGAGRVHRDPAADLLYAGAWLLLPPRPAPAGEACYAGAYVCPLDQPGPRGEPCSCPTNNGRAWGRIG
jgi:hypothetical protein